MNVLLVYIDDIIVIGDDQEEIQKLKADLARAFEIKDFGPIKYFLQWKFKDQRRGSW